MCLRPGNSELFHRVQDAALRGFESVAHVRQGARDDHGHRVIEKEEVLISSATLILWIFSLPV